jgi:glycosyltransferase involved in cell wall biosynthesis
MTDTHGKYLFVSSLLQYGGGERWMLDAAAGLQDRGHEVVIAARPGSALSYKAPMRGIPWTSLQMRSDYDPLAVLRLSHTFRHFHPDVVCPNLDREIRLCAMAMRLASPFLRGRSPRLIPRRGSEFPLKNNARYRHIYTRYVERVIVNSKATRRTMLSNTPWFANERTSVVYNGIDTTEYNTLLERREELRASLRSELGLTDTALIVVLVGELNERKGHRTLLRAAPAIVARFPSVHFLFVGEGDARAEIEESIAQHRLGANVSLVGFREDVAEILVGSDVLVLPSRVEGFGYVLVEAMAAGLPVVASNVSSIPEVVDEGVTGYLHPVGDVDVLTGHVCALVGTPERARRMGHRGRAAVANRFHIGRMIDEIESLFARP